MYVPKVLKPDHVLVRLLGWKDASKLVAAFAGEILQPANCAEVYRAFRDQTIIRMDGEGMSARAIAHTLEVSDRHVRNLLREKAQEALASANDNNRAHSMDRALS
jgi:hypothetical protein